MIAIVATVRVSVAALHDRGRAAVALVIPSCADSTYHDCCYVDDVLLFVLGGVIAV